MGEYEGALRVMEVVVGLVPGFMMALEGYVLVKEWPLFKKYVLGESRMPVKGK